VSVHRSLTVGGDQDDARSGRTVAVDQAGGDPVGGDLRVVGPTELVAADLTADHPGHPESRKGQERVGGGPARLELRCLSGEMVQYFLLSFLGDQVHDAFVEVEDLQVFLGGVEYYVYQGIADSKYRKHASQYT